MKKDRWVAVLALCILACFLIGVMTDAVHAQDKKTTKGTDKKLANKKGVSNSLAKKKDDDGTEGPSKLKMGIGVGSIFVMIAVVKWL
ncbi:MAG: hypothetical protein AAB353_10220 [Candidatus Hydrogenedentota bacterium]